MKRISSFCCGGNFRNPTSGLWSSGSSGGGGDGGSRLFAVHPGGVSTWATHSPKGSGWITGSWGYASPSFKIWSMRVTAGSIRTAWPTDGAQSLLLWAAPPNNYYDDATGTYDKYPWFMSIGMTRFTYCAWLAVGCYRGGMEFAARGGLKGSVIKTATAHDLRDANDNRSGVCGRLRRPG